MLCIACAISPSWDTNKRTPNVNNDAITSFFLQGSLYHWSDGASVPGETKELVAGIEKSTHVDLAPVPAAL